MKTRMAKTVMNLGRKQINKSQKITELLIAPMFNNQPLLPQQQREQSIIN